MRSITVGYTEHASAIELNLLTADDYEATAAKYGHAKVGPAFTRMLLHPKRHEPDVQIFTVEKNWTLEVAMHELMHAALHIAQLRGLPTSAMDEALPQLVGEFAARLYGPYFPGPAQ